MAKTYWVRFGSGDPRNFSGLTPTFLLFYNSAGSPVTPPSVTEIAASTGLYTFTWGPTTSIGFLLDGFTTSLTGDARYITGSLDPSDRIDEVGTTLVAIGTTNVALGTTNIAIGTTVAAIGTTLSAISSTLTVLVSGIGSTASSYGSSSQDPVDLFGYMKRIQENLEGNNIFTKGTGTLQILSRASATLLITKTVTNSASTVIKT